MRFICAIAFSCIGAIFCVVAQSSEKSNFFPIETDRRSGQVMLVLPFRCNEGSDIEWTSNYQSTLNGLAPNSRIKAYSDEGYSLGGVLGTPTCFVGACNANYVALPVNLDDGATQVLVISKDIPVDIKEVYSVKSEVCEDIPNNIEHPRDLGKPNLPMGCRDVIESSLDNRAIGQLLYFGWELESGWQLYHQFFRSVVTSPGATKQYGALTQVSISTSGQFPLFGFTLESGTPSILWFQRSGLGPVSKFILKESIFDKKGNIHWISKYEAGGQPCD